MTQIGEGCAESRIYARVKAGMERAKAAGKHIARPTILPTLIRRLTGWSGKQSERERLLGLQYNRRVLCQKRGDRQPLLSPQW
jgi:hypothetical protein